MFVDQKSPFHTVSEIFGGQHTDHCTNTQISGLIGLDAPPAIRFSENVSTTITIMDFFFFNDYRITGFQVE